MRTRMYGGVRGQGLAAPTYSIGQEAVFDDTCGNLIQIIQK